MATPVEIDIQGTGNRPFRSHFQTKFIKGTLAGSAES
jgi:hypothetical protein